VCRCGYCVSCCVASWKRKHLFIFRAHLRRSAASAVQWTGPAIRIETFTYQRALESQQE